MVPGGHGSFGIGGNVFYKLRKGPAELGSESRSPEPSQQRTAGLMSTVDWISNAASI